MAELRKHPLLNCWVIINQERSRRPGFTQFSAIAPKEGMCPFCEGNEEITPPEIFAIRPRGSADETGWRVRVVPNKFAILQGGAEAETFSDGFYQTRKGTGLHEVVIETPRHDQELHDLPVASVAEILFTFRERFRAIKKNPWIRTIQLFKNYGFMGGGSLEHAHSQILALPLVTKTEAEEQAAAKFFFEHQGHCIFCGMVQRELREARRVVFENEAFVAFCPFAPRYAFETWIVPKKHLSHFEDMDASGMDHLAASLKTVLMKTQKILDNPAYNFVICTSPVQEAASPYYHWRLEIMPLRSPLGGFERGSGFFVNPVSPERAAQILRESAA